MCWKSKKYLYKDVSKGIDTLDIKKTAKEDIIVYKIGFYIQDNDNRNAVEKFIPYFKNDYPYNINEETNEIELVFEPTGLDCKINFKVEQGYHSYSSDSDCWQDSWSEVLINNRLNHFCQHILKHPLVIGEFVIPKGSIYAIEKRIVVSSKIKWNGRFIIAENLPSVPLTFKEIFEKNENINDCNK